MNNLATVASHAFELSEDPCEAELDRALIKEIFGDNGPSLAQFLRFCAHSLETPLAGPTSPRFRRQRNSFLNAGLAELAFAPSDARWIQLGARPADARNIKEVYRVVLAQVRDLLDQNRISNFFFLHKPPGLRLRFETRSTDFRSARADLWATFVELQEREIIADLTPAVYEPESYLFGGTRSMRFVHDLFTFDSLAWLDFHITNNASQPGAAWMMSLIMLRQVFGGLGISGWEDLDVWERIRDKTGRSLPSEVRDSESFKVFSEQIRAAWQNGETFRDQLPAELTGTLQGFSSSTGPLLSRWLSEYFQTSHATIGPREAAAFFTIFHWNRAGIPLARQALITEALLRRAGK